MPLTYEQRQQRFFEKKGRYYGDYKPPNPDTQLKTNVMQGKELAPAESLYAQARGYIKPSKPVTVDPSQADADSLGLWTQQAIHGDKEAAGKITVRNNLLHPEKPKTRSQILQEKAQDVENKAKLGDPEAIKLTQGYNMARRAGQEKEPKTTSLDDVGYKLEKEVSDLNKILADSEGDTTGSYTSKRYGSKRKELETTKKLQAAGFVSKERGTAMKKKVDSILPTYQELAKKSPLKATQYLLNEFKGRDIQAILKLIEDLKD
jgi:hypothetical protein